LPRRERELSRFALIGALLGAIFLGLGGRLAMAAIVLGAGGAPHFTLAGTLRLMMLGAIAGIVGAIVVLISRIVAHRVAPGRSSASYWIFAILLLLVTALGFWASERATAGNQSQSVAWRYLSPCIALYGIALALSVRRQLRP
jgi:hypothetical protein